MLNLTQHPATSEQIESGVVDPSPEVLVDVKYYLTFNELPQYVDIERCARELTAIAVDEGASEVMIGGAPFLMEPLAATLRDNGIQPYYAFSKRESVEGTAEDGSVVKRNVFRHLGFVPGL